MDLSRVERVLGAEAVDAFSRASVCVFGLGGVGSYAAEALARTGIGRIGLVDFDTVAPSNINRQLCALTTTMGEYKAEVIRDRIATINPDCVVDVVLERFVPGHFDEVWKTGYDALIDAVDDVQAKQEIIIQALEREIPMVSVLGTGNKLEPEKLEVSDLFSTEACPLARRVRKRLRRRGITGTIPVVYSKEESIRPDSQDDETPAIPGSLAFVPGAAGLMAASVIARGILKRAGLL